MKTIAITFGDLNTNDGIRAVVENVETVFDALKEVATWFPAATIADITNIEIN